MTDFLLIALFACFGVGFILMITGIRRLRRGRLLRAGLYGGGGCLLVTLGVLVMAIGLNLHTYQRLTYEQPVAIIDFVKLGNQHFRAQLTTARDQQHRLELHGDEWQLDARVLKWSGAANVLGLDALYRLERLSGRYHRVEDETAKPRSVHPLVENEGLDLWTMAQRYPRALAWVDARYGSATYLPMADGARYRVSLSQTGLVARADNPAAQRAIDGWR